MSHDAKIQVEKGSHTSSDNPFSLSEKIYNIPYYVIRKLFLFYIKSTISTNKALCGFFGFEYDVYLSDEPRWNWFENFELPKYWLKKID